MKIFVEPKKLPSKITKLEFVSLVSDMGGRMERGNKRLHRIYVSGCFF